MRLVECGLEIDAPISRVWELLTALDRYPEWNPFVVRVDAEVPARVGTQMLLHVRWPRGGGARSPETVTVVEPPADHEGAQRARFEYRYEGLPHRLGLVRGSRVQTLEQRAGGPVRYHSTERFTGPLVFALPIARIQAGFDAQARALKAHAERR